MITAIPALIILVNGFFACRLLVDLVRLDDASRETTLWTSAPGLVDVAAAADCGHPLSGPTMITLPFVTRPRPH